MQEKEYKYYNIPILMILSALNTDVFNLFEKNMNNYLFYRIFMPYTIKFDFIYNF